MLRSSELEKPPGGTDGSDFAPSRNAVGRKHYRTGSRGASHRVVYRLDSKSGPEIWEEAYEARVAFLARQLAEVLESTHRLRQERDVARRQVRDLRVSLRRALGAI
jgi:hypothetical protein